jgi:hypothetical protein
MLQGRLTAGLFWVRDLSSDWAVLLNFLSGRLGIKIAEKMAQE